LIFCFIFLSIRRKKHRPDLLPFSGI